MSARTCQLCGRPLSRIWVGAGGDFCSREHRNQYGLRLGMDRLQEANKVATLMRRRENLKTVPPDSEAYKRYVKKFDVQETEIEQLMDTIKKLQDKEYKERKGYDSYLGSLDIE